MEQSFGKLNLCFKALHIIFHLELKKNLKTNEPHHDKTKHIVTNIAEMIKQIPFITK
jgi:hypothetical protein